MLTILWEQRVNFRLQADRGILVSIVPQPSLWLPMESLVVVCLYRRRNCVTLCGP